VLLGTGLRANEFLQLRLADIKNGEIKVRWETAKGKKSREVRLLPEVAQAIKAQADEMKDAHSAHAAPRPACQ
jgi:integrase